MTSIQGSARPCRRVAAGRRGGGRNIEGRKEGRAKGEGRRRAKGVNCLRYLESSSPGTCNEVITDWSPCPSASSQPSDRPAVPLRCTCTCTFPPDTVTPVLRKWASAQVRKPPAHPPACPPRPSRTPAGPSRHPLSPAAHRPTSKAHIKATLQLWTSSGVWTTTSKARTTPRQTGATPPTAA